MLKDLDTDVWGRGYRMVVKRAKMKRENRMSEEQQLAVARKLFPAVIDDVGEKMLGAEEVRPFTLE